MKDLWNGAPWSPRAWQRDALPVIIENLKAGRRGIVSATMGSGKSILQTALVAAALPKAGDRAIVVTAPRQALVGQLAETMRTWVGADTVGTFYADKKQADRPVVIACNASVTKLREQLEADGRRVALLICDEAHGTQGATLQDEIPKLDPAALVGFTATPFRSAPRESLELFDDVFVRYTITDAVADGVLVPMRHERFKGFDPDTVDETCLAMMKEHGHGPGIVSAKSIEDADSFAAWLTDRWFDAESIHSRHSRKQRADKLERLRTGEIRALVHVSLLSEGVDLPWLRWLCLRRNVRARVRFLQEIGRVFRVDPDTSSPWGEKTEGVVLDPHLLLGRHGLVNLEAIGKALEEAADADAEEGKRKPDKNAAEPTEEEVVALDELRVFLAELHSALTDRGLIKPSARYRTGYQGWRLAEISPKQVKSIAAASWATKHVPSRYRKTVAQLVRVPWALNKGDASDLLDVLWGGSRWARQYVDPSRGRYANHVQWDIGDAIPLPNGQTLKLIQSAAKRRDRGVE